VPPAGGKWQVATDSPNAHALNSPRVTRNANVAEKTHSKSNERRERTENWPKAQQAKNLSLHSSYHLPSSSYNRKRVKCRRAAVAVAVGLEKSARIFHFGQKTFNHVGALSCCCPQVEVRGQGCRGGIGACHIHGAAT